MTPHEIQTERVSQCDVGYADDLLLFANNLTDLETMINELMSALLPTGLEIGPEKTRWIRKTSRNRRGNDEVLKVGSISIAESQNLVFLGCLLQPDNNDLMSIDHRRKKGEQTWHAWKKILMNRAIGINRRVLLFNRAILASATWMCEIWKETYRNFQKLISWAHRKVGLMCGCFPKENEGETITAWWKRLHHTGRKRYLTLLKPIWAEILQKKHRFAGHMARSNCQHISSILRSLSTYRWWFIRDFFPFPRGHRGHHQGRYLITRWDEKLCGFSSTSTEYMTQDTSENIGWLREAQDRKSWKDTEIEWIIETWSDTAGKGINAEIRMGIRPMSRDFERLTEELNLARSRLQAEKERPAKKGRSSPEVTDTRRPPPQDDVLRMRVPPGFDYSCTGATSSTQLFRFEDMEASANLQSESEHADTGPSLLEAHFEDAEENQDLDVETMQLQLIADIFLDRN